jgi:hypothetical protein
MLDHQLSYSTATFNPPVLGKDLAERLRQMRPGGRAVLALSLTGVRGVTCLTRAQSSRLTEVPLYNIALANLATLDEQVALMRGELKLSDVRKAHAHAREMTDAEIVDFIERADPNRILEMLDRMTAPTTPTAETVVQFATAAEQASRKRRARDVAGSPLFIKSNDQKTRS